MKTLAVNLFFIILISFISYILGKDNYIKIYFNKDCNYLSGFENEYRYDIDFINYELNRNEKYRKDDSLIIVRSFGIEIHFDKTIRSLNHFFSNDIDENMEYLVSLDLSNFDTSKLTNMEYMFSGCYSLKSINLSNFDTLNVIKMSGVFYNCWSLEIIDLSNFNTSSVTDMSLMFSDCSSLKSIDLSSFNTSKVIIMAGMFFNCTALKFIDLSSFDTSHVTNMENMFTNCYSLESIDLSNFKTSKVIDMSGMFFNCSSLKSIDLSSFDTSLVTNMELMFNDCSSLTSIDLSSFHTLNVVNMEYMFYGCNSLQSIDLTHFNMINCNSYKKMFSNISNIKYINLYYFKYDKIISNIFKNTNDTIFVCQKDKIIDNPKAYICCDSNLKTYNCLGFKYLINTFIFGIIIYIIIKCNFCQNIWCCCSCKKKSNISNRVKLTIYEHEPQNDKENPMKVIFQNPIFGDYNILIDSNKTIDELIRFYFEISGRSELYGDRSIIFLIGGRSILPPYPNDTVETLKNRIVNSETIKIIVQNNND